LTDSRDARKEVELIHSHGQQLGDRPQLEHDKVREDPSETLGPVLVDDECFDQVLPEELERARSMQKDIDEVASFTFNYYTRFSSIRASGISD